MVCLLLLAPMLMRGQYTAGDYGSWNSGPWNTLATWRVYDGSSWLTSPAAAAPPNSTHTVWIRPGTTVTAVFGAIYHCRNLMVEAGGKLFNNNTGPTSLSYVTIYGTTLRCDGVIGNSPTLDGISFNIEGVNVLLSGTGQFEAARLRKPLTTDLVPGPANVTTNLTIDMDITLRFSGGSNTMIYNNNGNTSTNFNVTINAGRTVNLSGAVGAGNISVDGVDGLGSGERGGTFTVNGTLLIPGILYLTSNNTLPAYQARFTINNGGYVRCNQISAGASGAGGHLLTVNSGGTLEIMGTPIGWTVPPSTTNNTYQLDIASTVIYGATGNQDVQQIPHAMAAFVGYGNLLIRGSGTKTLQNTVSVRGNLTISNAIGAPVLDVSASNFSLSVGGNWTNYSTTGFNERTGTAVVQFFGTGNNQSINTIGGEDFNIWRIVKSVGFPQVTMQSDVRVANALQLNTAGILDLNGRLLTLLNPGAGAITTNSTFGTLRHIRSERTDNTSRVRWDMGTTTGAHLVPFGTTAAYTPFTFNLVSGDAGSVTMATYGTPPSNLPWPTTPTLVTSLESSIGLMPDNRDATVDRFWQVDVTGTPVAHLSFFYAASELPSAPWNDALSMRAQRWNSATQRWEDQLESGGAGSFFAVANNVAAFGPFSLTPLLSPLPVELLSFAAVPVGRVVELEWLTASERNSDHFAVLRSADGLRFEEMLQVAAAGQSSSLRRYATVDDAPLSGTSYYQLKTVDADGTHALSPILAVRFEGTTTLMVYPNPATDRMHVQGEADGWLGIITLHDAAGRMVLRQGVNAASGIIDVTGLPRGAYVLRADDGRSTPQRVVLQ